MAITAVRRKRRDTLGHGPLKEAKKQMYRRLRLITRVSQYGGQTNYWRAINVSEGGIFVKAAPTLSPGTQTEIGFHLPQTKDEIRCLARVVWRNDANDPEFDPNKPFGMGLEFVDLSTEQKELIRDYVTAGLDKEASQDAKNNE